MAKLAFILIISWTVIGITTFEDYFFGNSKSENESIEQMPASNFNNSNDLLISTNTIAEN